MKLRYNGDCPLFHLKLGPGFEQLLFPLQGEEVLNTRPSCYIGSLQMFLNMIEDDL